MERLPIEELIEHCDRQMNRILSGNKFYQEHESVRAYLQILRHYIAPGLTPERVAELSQADQAGRLVVLPCKIGDTVWTIKNFKGHERARMGYVSEMFFTKYMKLFIVVKNTGRGFWGEDVFPSEAGAVAALERRKENT